MSSQLSLSLSLVKYLLTETHGSTNLVTLSSLAIHISKEGYIYTLLARRDLCSDNTVSDSVNYKGAYLKKYDLSLDEL